MWSEILNTVHINPCVSNKQKLQFLLAKWQDILTTNEQDSVLNSGTYVIVLSILPLSVK